MSTAHQTERFNGIVFLEGQPVKFKVDSFGFGYRDKFYKLILDVQLLLHFGHKLKMYFFHMGKLISLHLTINGKTFQGDIFYVTQTFPSIIGRIWIRRLSQPGLDRPTMWESYIQTISQLVKWVKRHPCTLIYLKRKQVVFSTLQYLQSGEKAPHQSTIEIEMFLTLIEKVYFELDTLITVGIVSGKVDTSDWGSSLALLSTFFFFNIRT